MDIDLSKFFGRFLLLQNRHFRHPWWSSDTLIDRLGKIVEDKRILRLVGLILRSGIMKDGLVTPSLEGSVQGSPLSPLLSNVVLDELDKK